MMLFVIFFKDIQDSELIRERCMDAHISWLIERRDSVLLAGSLREEADLNPRGALWVVEAESKREAAKIFESDPFWTNGMRQKVEIYHWSKAFEEKVLV